MATLTAVTQCVRGGGVQRHVLLHPLVDTRGQLLCCSLGLFSLLGEGLHVHSFLRPMGPVTLTQQALGTACSPPATQGYKRSPQGAGMQGLLDLFAATRVLLQDLSEVFFFLSLQDTQKVV